MNYWLVKSEPETYSWEKFIEDGETRWDGVRNFAARIHLKVMKKGDIVFFYHSGDDKCIVGIAKVAKEFYPDPTAREEGWVAVDLIPYKKLKKPVTLAQVKADKRMQTIALVRIGRLSVMPITNDEYNVIIEMNS